MSLLRTSLQTGFGLQCGQYCGKQFVAAANPLQNFFTKALTRMPVAIR